MAWNTGCTSDRELAMTFNISAVAACCARASFRSWPAAETGRLTRVAGATRRLVPADLRRFAGLALRPFALPVLPPVLDGRAICAPEVETRILAGHPVLQEGPDGAKSRLTWLGVGGYTRTSRAGHGCPPGANAGLMPRSKTPSLFDQLVGGGEERGRNGEVERPCGLEVDHQLVPG